MNILQLRKQGLSISDIARRSGRDRKTIREYLKQPCQLPKRKPITYPGKLDPFKDYLVKRWDEGVSSAVKLLDEIKGQGYAGGYTTVKDFLRPLREQAKNQAVVRFETLPGQQAQVD